jgi:hypothetical protein
MTPRVRASILAITFAVLVALPSIAAAQSKAVFGIKAGANIATLKGADINDDDPKSLTGVSGGLFVSSAINDNVGWRADLLFSQKGAKFEEAGQTAKAKLTYIDVPFVLTVGPSSSGNTRVNAFTGPQISFNTAAKTVSQGHSEDFKDDVKSTDFGWLVGVGVDAGRFMASAQYALGLTKIAKDGDNIKNRVFSIHVGVNLNK